MAEISLIAGACSSKGGFLYEEGEAPEEYDPRSVENVVTHEEFYIDQVKQLKAFRERCDDLKTHCEALVFKNRFEELKLVCYDYLNFERYDAKAGDNLLLSRLMDKILTEGNEARLEELKMELANSVKARLDSVRSLAEKRIGLFEGATEWPLFDGSRIDTSVLTDDIIVVRHGGGLRFLLDFFEGKKLGYKLEDDGSGVDYGFGIQVGITPKERERFYAEGRSEASFDIPVAITGQIRRKFLFTAANDYEAGLSAKNTHRLKNITFDPPLTYEVIPEDLRVRMERIEASSREPE